MVRSSLMVPPGPRRSVRQKLFREKSGLDLLGQFHFLLGGQQVVAAQPPQVVRDGVVGEASAAGKLFGPLNIFQIETHRLGIARVLQAVALATLEAAHSQRLDPPRRTGGSSGLGSVTTGEESPAAGPGLS